MEWHDFVASISEFKADKNSAKKHWECVEKFERLSHKGIISQYNMDIIDLLCEDYYAEDQDHPWEHFSKRVLDETIAQSSPKENILQLLGHIGAFEHKSKPRIVLGCIQNVLPLLDKRGSYVRELLVRIMTAYIQSARDGSEPEEWGYMILQTLKVIVNLQDVSKEEQEFIEKYFLHVCAEFLVNINPDNLGSDEQATIEELISLFNLRRWSLIQSSINLFHGSMSEGLRQSSYLDADAEGKEILISQTPTTGLCFIIYLMMKDGNLDFIPSPLVGEFALMCLTPYANHMLSRKSTGATHKGMVIIDCSFVVVDLHPIQTDEVHYWGSCLLSQSICRTMSEAPVPEIRRKAHQILFRWIRIHTPKGRFHLLKYLLANIQHDAIHSILWHQWKEELRVALSHNLQSIFTSSTAVEFIKRQLYLLTIESDILDFIEAASGLLNCFRFAILADKVDLLGLSRDGYLKELKDIRLRRLRDAAEQKISELRLILASRTGKTPKDAILQESAGCGHQHGAGSCESHDVGFDEVPLLRQQCFQLELLEEVIDRVKEAAESRCT